MTPQPKDIFCWHNVRNGFFLAQDFVKRVKGQGKLKKEKQKPAKNKRFLSIPCYQLSSLFLLVPTPTLDGSSNFMPPHNFSIVLPGAAPLKPVYLYLACELGTITLLNQTLHNWIDWNCLFFTDPNWKSKIPSLISFAVKASWFVSTRTRIEHRASSNICR